jgi:hypothetical protein
MARALAGTTNVDFPAALAPAQFAAWQGSHAYRP